MVNINFLKECRPAIQGGHFTSQRL